MSESGILVIGILVYSIACGTYAGIVANAKGWDQGGWFFAGFFFGIIGLIGAAGMPTRSKIQE